MNSNKSKNHWLLTFSTLESIFVNEDNWGLKMVVWPPKASQLSGKSEQTSLGQEPAVKNVTTILHWNYLHRSRGADWT